MIGWFTEIEERRRVLGVGRWVLGVGCLRRRRWLGGVGGSGE